MDREILFRGKRVSDGEWVYGYYANCRPPRGRHLYETRHYIIEYPGTYHEIYTSTLGQFTGLTDKNGKKIFEGDIVSRFEWWNGSHKNAIVKMEYGAWIIREDSGHYDELWLSGFPPYEGKCEVVGNIHDNPELMGGTENGTA